MRNKYLKNNGLIKCFFSILLLNLFSCSPKAYQFYYGPKKNKNEIATIISKDPVRLIRIDGKIGSNGPYFGYSRTFDSKCIVELNPGVHKLSIIIVTTTLKYERENIASNNWFYREYTKVSEEKIIEFNFIAGKIYKIISGETQNPYITEIDEISFE